MYRKRKLQNRIENKENTIVGVTEAQVVNDIPTAVDLLAPVNDVNTEIILNYGNTNIKSSDEIKSDDSTDDNIEIHTDDFINDIEDGIINLSSDDIIEDSILSMPSIYLFR